MSSYLSSPPPFYHVLRATLLSLTHSSLCVAGRAYLSGLPGKGGKDPNKTTVTNSWYLLYISFTSKRERESESKRERRVEVWRRAGSYFCPCRLRRGWWEQCLSCGEGNILAPPVLDAEKGKGKLLLLEGQEGITLISVDRTYVSIMVIMFLKVGGLMPLFLIYLYFID